MSVMGTYLKESALDKEVSFVVASELSSTLSES